MPICEKRDPRFPVFGDILPNPDFSAGHAAAYCSNVGNRRAPDDIITMSVNYNSHDDHWSVHIGWIMLATALNAYRNQSVYQNSVNDGRPFTPRIMSVITFIFTK